MILDGKYIAAHKNNYKQLISLLIKYGYIDSNNDVADYIEQILIRADYKFSIYVNYDNVLSACLYDHTYVYVPQRTELDITKLLRENKLKRILK